jgi:hypothetical protein
MERMGLKSLHNVSITLREVTGVSNNILTPEDWKLPMYNANEFIGKYSDNLIKFIKESNHNAFSDNPYPLFYKQLVAAFPDAKFIIFKRDAEKWLHSINTYFGKSWTHFRRILYDSNKDPEYWMNKYLDHNNEVISYFREIGVPLLVIDMDNEIDIGGKLNEFLELPTKFGQEGIKIKFPTLNQIKKP